MEGMERSLRSDTIRNALLRVVGGVSGGIVAGEPPASRAVGKNRKGEKRLRPKDRDDRTGERNFRATVPRLSGKSCAPFAPGSPTRPTGVRARFQSEAAAGVPFGGGAPEEAGTSKAIAGRGGNDEGAKHDVL